jgi:hypothetical protein
MQAAMTYRPQAPLGPRIARSAVYRPASPMADARLSLNPPKLLSAHQRMQPISLKVGRMFAQNGLLKGAEGRGGPKKRGLCNA